jgi:4-carboxymuconolactone decarboxylase
VDRTEAAVTDFDAPFQAMITEGAWGTLWSDGTISRRERSMLTLAPLAATGNVDEIPMHFRAAAPTGATKVDVMQAFLHVVVHAGTPIANQAIKLAKAACMEMEGEAAMRAPP